MVENWRPEAGGIAEGRQAELESSSAADMT